MKKRNLYIVLLLPVLIGFYLTETYLHIGNYLILGRCVLMALTFFLSMMIRFTPSFLKKLDKSISPHFFYIISSLIWLLVIAIGLEGAELFHAYQLKNDHKIIDASFKDCETSEGSRYCIYEFEINNTIYENKVRVDNNISNGDKIKIAYFLNNPNINSPLQELNE